MSGSTNLKELAILGPQQMAEFLQLAFVIRNTDTLIDELLSAKEPLESSQVATLVERMTKVAAHAGALVKYIRKNTKGLPAIKWD